MTDLAERPTALYRFHDAEGNLLYVGITHDLKKRWSTHRLQRTWWHLVATKTYEWYENRPLAVAAEKEALEHEHPRFDASFLDSRGYRVGGNRYEDPRRDEIAVQLRADIEAGVFPRGRTIPRSTVLAERYETSPMTVAMLTWELQRRGVLDGDGPRYWLRGSRPRKENN